MDGSRELSRARCKMKKCCLTKGHITCADCGEYEPCETKYKQVLEFISAHDYAAL